MNKEVDWRRVALALLMAIMLVLALKGL